MLEYLTAPVEVDAANPVAPYFFYRRVAVNAARQFESFAVDYGFAYFLRRIMINWPQVVISPAVPAPPFPPTPAGLGPDILVEVFDRGSNKPRQEQPIVAQEFCTPGGRDIYTRPAPLPADATAFGVNFFAGRRASQKILNWLYGFHDNIEVTLSGQVFAVVAGWNPPYIDVMLEGYNVAATELALWGQGGSN